MAEGFVWGGREGEGEGSEDVGGCDEGDCGEELDEGGEIVGFDVLRAIYPYDHSTLY